MSPAPSHVFPRTLRALVAEREVPLLVAAGLGLALLGAWGAWLGLARLPVLARTSQARVELADRARPLQVLVGGRVLEAWLEVGRPVEAGEPLLVLDSTDVDQRLEQAIQRKEAVDARLEIRRQELELARSASDGAQAVGDRSVGEARARLEEAESMALLAEQERDRTETLLTLGAVSEGDGRQARSLAQQRRAAAEGLARALERARLQAGLDQDDRQLRVQQIVGELKDLEGEQAVLQAELARLTWERDQMVLVAEEPGTLAEVEPIPPGSLVAAGARVATLLPRGAPSPELVVVAFFPPGEALGRLAPAQPGRLRLTGFPWGQYGSIPLQVERVSSEIRDGLLRVELGVPQDLRTAVPLQHGLPGSVEVEVERARPLDLLLRAAGRMVSAPEPGEVQ